MMDMAFCRACHRSREIEAALATPGASERSVAVAFRIPRTSLRRHMEEHAGRQNPTAPTIVHALAIGPAPLPPGAPRVTGAPFEAEIEIPRTICTICVSVDRADIDQAIMRGALYSAIDKAHDLDAGASGRHARQCCPDLLAVAGDRQAKRSSGDKPKSALERAVAAADSASQLVADAEASTDIRLRATALTAHTKSIEVLARLNGELGSDEVKLLESPQFMSFMAKLMGVLKPFPAARDAAKKLCTGDE